jgi:uncharacterized protein (TIGR02996 family)
MTGHDPVSAFYLVLEESPGDTATLLALSDWYEEHGDLSAAECVRWSARRKRWPFRYWRDGPLSVASADWHDGWFWWTTDDPHYGTDWGHPQECRLPQKLWISLRHSIPYSPLVVKEYQTVREAYEALVAAWPRAQPLEPRARPRGRQP